MIKEDVRDRVYGFVYFVSECSSSGMGFKGLGFMLRV